MTEITKKEVTDITTGGANVFGVGGFEGFDSTDLVMPTVRIVQPNSTEVTLQDGTDAPAGHFYHKGRKESYKELEVVMIMAKKGSGKDINTGEPFPQARVLAVNPGRLDDPFAMFFGKSTYWGKFKPFANSLRSYKLANIWDRIVKITVEKVKNDKGAWFVPIFEIGKETTKEQREMAQAVYEKYGIWDPADGEDAVETTPAVDTSDLDNLDLSSIGA